MVRYLKSLFIVILSSLVAKPCRGTSTSSTTTSTTVQTTPEAESPYLTYVLEDICHKEEEIISVYLKGWSALIVTLGQSGDGEYYDRDKHTCTLKITTDKGFHLGGVVEYIRIQGTQDPATKRWECEDYIIFRTKGAGFVNQVLDMLLPDKIFKGRESEKLCGERMLDTSKIFRMVDKSSHSNVFSTMANTLEFEYHQNQDLKTPVNNSFTVVISTFRHINEHECSGQVMCSGGGGTAATSTEPNYCVHQRYYCDDHVNCALPGGGTDERGCPGGEVTSGLSAYSVVFSSTIILFIALGSIVGGACILVILYTLVSRARAGDINRSSSSDSNTAVNFMAACTDQSAGQPQNDCAITTTPHRHRHHRHRHHRRSKHHHHHRNDDQLDEDEEERRRRGEDLERSSRNNRSRSRNHRGSREEIERRNCNFERALRGGPRRQPSRVQSHYDITTAAQQHALQQEAEKSQQEPGLVNQYNSFNRVNSLNSSLNPNTLDIQRYPPSYDILFPTDG